MNKRIRKKRHLREYTVYGVGVRGTFEDLEFGDPFVDAYLSWMETLGFGSGGGFNREGFQQFVTHKDRSMTEADRQAIIEAWSTHPLIGTLTVSPLIDAYWGDFKAFGDPAAGPIKNYPQPGRLHTPAHGSIR